MALRIDSSQNRNLYVGTGTEVAVNDGNAIVTGNVGIGTTSPTTTLSVQGTSSNGINVIGVGTTATRCYLGLNSANKGYLFIAGSSGENPAVITSQGNSYISTNLGIGTTSPSQKLHLHNGTLLIDSDAGISSGIWMPDLNGNPSLRIVTDQSSAANSSIVNAWGNSSNAGVMVGSTRNDGFAFQVRSGVTLTNGFANDTGNSRMVVLGNGNVGIGTTNPSSGKLVVEGDNYVITNSGKSLGGIDLRTNANPGAGLYTGGISFGGASTGRAAISGVQGTSADGDRQGLAFFTHGSGTGSADAAEAMRISTDGNVGIGTDSPDAKLEVDGSFNVINGNNGITHFNYQDGSTNYVRGVTYFDDSSVYFTGGNIGIGTTTPGEPLTVKTKTAAYFPGIKIEDYNSSMGLYVQNIEGGNSGIGTGRYYNSSLWRSDVTAPTAIRLDEGVIRFYAQSGVTADTNYTPTERMRISSAGAIKFNAYDSTNQTGTPTYLLGTDASGNVVKTTTVPGSGAGPYLPLSAGSSYPLTDTLYIQPTGSPTNTMLISARANDTYGNIQFTNAAETANWTELRSTSTQFTINNVKVGIGTTSPVEKLQVEGKVYIQGNGQDWNETTPGQTRGSIHFDPGTNVANTGNALTFGASDSPGAPNEGSNAQAGIYTRSDGSYGSKMYFATSDSYAVGSKTRMMIDYNGNVGIGTTSPERILHLDADQGRAIIQLDKGGDKIVSIGTGSSATGADDTILQLLNEGVEKVRIFTEGSSYFNGGNVGIGTTNPAYKLVVYETGTATSNVAIDARATGAGTNNYAVWAEGSGASSTNFAFYGAAGKNAFLGDTGIGTDNPQTKLHVEGLTRITEGGNTAFYSGNYVRLFSSQAYQFRNSGGSVIANINLSGDSYFNGGNVGIGTTSPQQLLHISNTSGGFGAEAVLRGSTSTGIPKSEIAFKRFTSGDGAEMVLRTSNSGGTLQDVMTLATSGNVGIGTTSPSRELDVENSSDNAIISAVSSGSHIAGLVLGDTADDDKGGILYNNTSDYLYFLSNGSERMRIDSSGNVGIGTDSPGSKLQVAGEIRVADGNKGTPSYTFTSDTNTGMYSDTADVIDFTAGGTKSLSVTTSGATVYGSALMPSNAAILLQNQNNNNQYYIRNSGGTNATFQVGQGSPGSNVRFFINGSGNVGIGNTASTASVKLEVTGNTLLKNSNGVGDLYLGNYATANHFRFHTNNANTYFDMNCGDIYWRQGTSTRYQFFPSTANMTVQGTITQNSDARIKENVVEISDCISKVQAMRGVYYNRTDFNTEVTKVGVIAQEVEAVLPELVLESPETGLKSVAYSELTSVLINAIKEQQEIIEDLKTRITKLEN